MVDAAGEDGGFRGRLVLQMGRAETAGGVGQWLSLVGAVDGSVQRLYRELSGRQGNKGRQRTCASER
jgi:hypothetical protein